MTKRFNPLATRSLARVDRHLRAEAKQRKREDRRQQAKAAKREQPVPAEHRLDPVSWLREKALRDGQA